MGEKFHNIFQKNDNFPASMFFFILATILLAKSKILKGIHKSARRASECILEYFIAL